MILLNNIVGEAIKALSVLVLVLVGLPDLAQTLRLDATACLMAFAPLLALCALAQPYTATASLMAHVRRYSDR